MNFSPYRLSRLLQLGALSLATWAWGHLVSGEVESARESGARSTSKNFRKITEISMDNLNIDYRFFTTLAFWINISRNIYVTDYVFCIFYNIISRSWKWPCFWCQEMKDQRSHTIGWLRKRVVKPCFWMSTLRYNLYLTLYDSSAFMTWIFAYNKDGFWSLSYFGKDNWWVTSLFGYLLLKWIWPF